MRVGNFDNLNAATAPCLRTGSRRRFGALGITASLAELITDFPDLSRMTPSARQLRSRGGKRFVFGNIAPVGEPVPGTRLPNGAIRQRSEESVINLARLVAMSGSGQQSASFNRKRPQRIAAIGNEQRLPVRCPDERQTRHVPRSEKPA